MKTEERPATLNTLRDGSTNGAGSARSRSRRPLRIDLNSYQQPAGTGSSLTIPT